MQSRGLPDIVGVYRGRGFGLEVKRPGKRNTLTPLQAKTLRDIRDAGGIGFLVTSVDEALAALGIDA